jgi:hypothetical protein
MTTLLIVIAIFAAIISIIAATIGVHKNSKKKYFEREFWCKNCEQTAIRKFPAGTTIIQACLAGDGTSYKILPGKPGHIELRCELCEVGALF